MHVNPRAIANAALERLPAALDEPWLRETWAGGHGRLRLRADMHEVASVANLGEHSLEASAYISGTVQRRSGGTVGSVTREVNLHPNGRLGVYHAYLKLDPSVHKTGFAGRFNEQAFKRYAEAGVDDVTVTAALSAGGYVWARTGFELAPNGALGGEAAEQLQRARRLRDLVIEARADKRITAREMRRLERRLLAEDDIVRPGTLTEIRDLAAIDGLGEKVLKGQAWRGLRTIDKTASWWSTAARPVPASVAGTSDASAGVAHLRAATDEPAAMAHVRRSIAAQLPDALEPGTITRALERSTTSHTLQLVGTADARTSIDLLDPAVHTQVPLRVLDDAGAQLGTGEIRISPNTRGELEAHRSWELVDGVSARTLNAATNDAMRGVGITRVTDGIVRPSGRYGTRTTQLAT